MIAIAVLNMSERQSSWRPTELHREIAAVFPAAVRRFGPLSAHPWEVATAITAGDILAPRPVLRWHRIG